MLREVAYALWFVAPALQCAIAYRMWARRLYCDYPLFFTYTLSHLVTFPVVLYLYNLGNADVYRYTFVGFEAVDAILKFAVICELFAHVFRPYQGIRGLGSLLLRWASVILLLIAVAVAARATGSDSDRFLAGLFVMKRSMEIIQGGLLLVLFVVSSSLGMAWKRDLFGIALGFGLIASVNLAAFTLRVQFGGSTTDLLSIIASTGYDCAVAIWLVALWARESVHQFDRRVPTWDVEAWNRALLNLLRQ